ncbi:MAG TPA: hypothetical protein VNJ28_08760 [Candidatus Limnocylindrales bacterium]|nr:hypothetical protein [Candidatus Limnocylindrales bacterium]
MPFTTRIPADPVIGLSTPTVAVWVDRDRAVLARRAASGSVVLSTVAAADDPWTYLSRVVDELYGARRIVVLGPAPMRTALEREYVQIYHRPDRLVEVEPVGDADERELVSRILETVAASTGPLPFGTDRDR